MSGGGHRHGRALVAMVFLVSSCANTHAKGGRNFFKEADVVLEVQALRVHAIAERGSADVVEADPAKAAVVEAIVNFRIIRILKGEWASVPVGGPSRADQAVDAVRKKDYFKILTLDFHNPEKRMKKEWVSVAVENPRETFGISSWDAPEPRHLKLYLKRSPVRKDSFLLLKALPC